MKRLGFKRSVTGLGLRLGVAVAILAGSVISMEAAPKPPRPKSKPPKGTTAAHHALQQNNKKKAQQLLLQQQRKNAARK